MKIVMSRKQQQRIGKAVAVLDEQREKLKRLHKDYYSAYDAAFDQHGAAASIERWCDRTAKLLEEHVSAAEAARFRRSLPSAPRGRGSWHWGELCQFLDTYLIRLIEDMEEHPDDPSYHDSQPTADTKAVGVADKYDVFLSYSTQDKDEARAIHAALAKAGKKCFLAERNIKPGDKFRDEIRAALAGSKEVWILLSPNSVKSEWVQREVSAAWALEKRIVPILFRCGPSDLPDILADTHAIDYHRIAEHIARLR